MISACPSNRMVAVLLPQASKVPLPIIKSLRAASPPSSAMTKTLPGDLQHGWLFRGKSLESLIWPCLDSSVGRTILFLNTASVQKQIPSTIAGVTTV